MSSVATPPFSTAPVGRVLADVVPGALLRDAALVIGGAGLVGASAQVAIATPLSPVPFTLQTLAVLLVGAALGPARGAAALALYLVAGVAGLPWFAGHAAGYAGASFGYVVGFVVAAGVVGWLARRGADRRLLRSAGLLALGNLIVYAVGAGWLAADLAVSPATALRLGVLPFVLTDALKIVLAAGLLPTAWGLVRRFHR